MAYFYIYKYAGFFAKMEKGVKYTQKRLEKGVKQVQKQLEKGVIFLIVLKLYLKLIILFL